MKVNSNAVRVTALVLLSGLGFYLSLLVPALTMTWASLPVGLIFLIAAAVLLTYMIRGRKSSSHTGA